MLRKVLLAALVCAVACGVGRAFQGSGGEQELSDTPQNDFSAGGGDGSGGPSTVGTIPTDPGPVIVTGAPIDPNAPGCAHGSVSASRVPVHLMLTIDRSGSMGDNKEATAQGRPTKWVALQSALSSVLLSFGTAADAGDQTLALGIDYFSDDGTNETKVEWPMAPVTSTYTGLLVKDLNKRSAGGITPTEDALNNSYAAVIGFTPAAGSPLAGGDKVVVLVSDGKPNPATATPQTIPNLVAGELAGTPSVRTFAIGVGEPGSTGKDGYDPVFMSWVAFSGGTGKSGCDPTEAVDQTKYCHFQITPSVAGANIANEFVDAFNAIHQQIQSCSLKLNIPDPTQLEPRATIVVAQTGDVQEILPEDPSNGWTFDNPANPTSIILNGSECATIDSNPATNVFAIVGCPCATGTATGGGSGGSSGGVTPGRDSPARAEGGTGSTGGTTWNTDWCSYPWVPGAGGSPNPGG